MARGVESRLISQPRWPNFMTEVVTEMRSCSMAIQSLVAWRAALRALTAPAIWMAPPKRTIFR